MDIDYILGQLRTRELTVMGEKTYSYTVLDKLLEAMPAKHVATGHTTETNTLLTRFLGEALLLQYSGLLFEMFHHDCKYPAV